MAPNVCSTIFGFIGVIKVWLLSSKCGVIFFFWGGVGAETSLTQSQVILSRACLILLLLQRETFSEKVQSIVLLFILPYFILFSKMQKKIWVRVTP